MGVRTSPSEKTSHVDIVIAGGGPAGAALAVRLGHASLRVACIDREDHAAMAEASFDGRTMAISYGSHLILEKAGLWDKLKNKACPIRDIQITQDGAPSMLDFLSQETGHSAFGWVVENPDLRRALGQGLMEAPNVQCLQDVVTDYKLGEDHIETVLQSGGAVRAKLVIGADGRNSFTRQWAGIGTRGWPYRQRAIVCMVRHEHPHNNKAVEDFRNEGPFAILPVCDDAKGAHRSSIVWTEKENTSAPIQNWDDETFTHALNERFPAFYGRVALAGPRFAYPLSLRHAHRYIAPRMALIGDAAHGIHPIAGQGLNLGLRDIDALADLLISAHGHKRDYGDTSLLENYQKARRADTVMMAAATDLLDRVFSNDIAPLRFLRSAGLRAIRRMPKTRAFLIRQAMGLRKTGDQ